MATAEVVWNGDRKRTLYSITPTARRPCGRWLADDPGPQRLESEPAVRILFGNLGSKDDLHAAIRRVAADAQEWVTQLCDLGDQYARGEGPFPERIHVNALLITLMVEQARTTLRWATWATEAVDRWDDTATPNVEWATTASTPRRRRGRAVQRRDLTARSIWRFASRSARSRRLSIRSLPRATAISTFTRPSLK